MPPNLPPAIRQILLTWSAYLRRQNTIQPVPTYLILAPQHMPPSCLGWVWSLIQQMPSYLISVHCVIQQAPRHLTRVHRSIQPMPSIGVGGWSHADCAEAYYKKCKEMTRRQLQSIKDLKSEIAKINAQLELTNFVKVKLTLDNLFMQLDGVQKALGENTIQPQQNWEYCVEILRQID